MPVHCPRQLRFSHGEREYLVLFHFEPGPPEQKCSNPECEDEGAFAVRVVPEDIYILTTERRTSLLQTHPLWQEIAAIVQMRFGHGKTHCQTDDSVYCESAMNRQSFIATFLAFGVRVEGRAGWKKVAAKMVRQEARRERKRLKKEEKRAKKLRALENNITA